MIGYQYIIDLFQQILNNSKAIQGRFYLGHRYGLQDVNYDNLGQVFNAIQASKKYPLVMMAPPHSTMKLSGGDEGWDDHRITLFFAKESYKEDILVTTKTSSHTIPQDWHDMKRAAVGFLRVLRNTMVTTPNSPFRYLTHHDVVIIPFSQVGADRISGVRIDFDLKLYVGCDLEDYDEYPDNIFIDGDTHAEHNL